MRVSSSAHLRVNAHLRERGSAFCQRSGSHGVPGTSPQWPCQDGCEGLSAARAVHQLGTGSQGNKQPEECWIWNGMLRPMHRLMLVSFENQMLLGIA